MRMPDVWEKNITHNMLRVPHTEVDTSTLRRLLPSSLLLSTLIRSYIHARPQLPMATMSQRAIPIRSESLAPLQSACRYQEAHINFHQYREPEFHAITIDHPAPVFIPPTRPFNHVGRPHECLPPPPPAPPVPPLLPFPGLSFEALSIPYDPDDGRYPSRPTIRVRLPSQTLVVPGSSRRLFLDESSSLSDASSGLSSSGSSTLAYSPPLSQESCLSTNTDYFLLGSGAKGVTDSNV
jgi:hypothetical protein